ncbi:MAG: DUF58 domain-containing protein [Chitinophagaceae bacterium]|jgi:uncharacterized protein (DUF58 family)|nr:DUF58 domain-containing protein [Chitinophagaceae bacterium]
MKAFIRTYIGALYLKTRFFAGISIVSILFILQFFLPWLGVLPALAAILLVALFLLDYFLLFGRKEAFEAARKTPERLSNGDENELFIRLKSGYSFPVYLEIVDEIPFQFQERNLLFQAYLQPREERSLRYTLRPVKRGEYDFGLLNVYVSGPIGFVQRRFRFGRGTMVPVYPSFLQMRRFQLLAIGNRLSEIGIKKIRRIGHSMEFEQIKDYVQGDDVRTLNWKATARRSQLMVNSFTEEKSQQVYCVIDKSRGMKMPFNGLSLMDYAINASLVLSNVALLKQDKAGMITFAEDISAFLPASRQATQMQRILDLLYRQKTRYLEADYEKLYSLVRNRITQRSLVVLFTNFESLTALHRQLVYLRRMARHHLLMVVFFENTELRDRMKQPAETLEEVYVQTIAAKFAYEKKLIVRELQQHGILSLFTAPENLTINTVNKYLELKARQTI